MNDRSATASVAFDSSDDGRQDQPQSPSGRHPLRFQDSTRLSFLGTEKPYTTVHAQHLLCRGMGMHCAGALRFYFFCNFGRYIGIMSRQVRLIAILCVCTSAILVHTHRHGRDMNRVVWIWAGSFVHTVRGMQDV